MESILDKSLDELKGVFSPSYKAKQIFDWVYKKFIYNFDEMSNLSKTDRAELKERFIVNDLEIVDRAGSLSDETIKFLFRTGDQKYIEAVLILSGEDYNDEEESDFSRMTLCVSSQVGCALGCTFCATGMLGFTRNLNTSEIVSQVILVEGYLKELFQPKEMKRSLTNIVFMGMGEPMLNYENVIKSIRILGEEGGYNMGMRNFTISTIGIPEGIKRLSEEGLQIRLALSLHSGLEETRKELMPYTKRVSLESLIDELINYQSKVGRRITIEYIIIPGVNDSEAEAVALKEILKELKYNVNLIAYNPVEGTAYQKPNRKIIKQFVQFLDKYKIPYVLRKSKGGGIDAGCGQLGLKWSRLK